MKGDIFMQHRIEKLFTVNFFYSLFLLVMLPLVIVGKEPIDILYFVIITIYYIKLKLYEKKII